MGDRLDLDAPPLVLAASNGILYTAGRISEAGGAPSIRIAQWDGARWTTLGEDVKLAGGFGTVHALAVLDGVLFVGGRFDQVGTVSANNIAQWDGARWSALGSGVDDAVYALAVWGGVLYAGGGFSEAGGMPANRIAQWDGTRWSALGSGIRSSVRALVTLNAARPAGGELARAGSQAAPSGQGRARGLHNDLQTAPYVLAALDDVRYMGGLFTAAGSVSAHGVSTQGGAHGSILGSEQNGSVRALAALDGALYAAGFFTEAGEVSASNIARWDGTGWSALGSGANYIVAALAVLRGQLYAGGFFTEAGDRSAPGIAKWDGRRWGALGSGVDLGVYSLAVLDDKLYVGGEFTEAGGAPAGSVARWDGETLSTLGAGVTEGDLRRIVFALAAADGAVYAGGSAGRVGHTHSPFVAAWRPERRIAVAPIKYALPTDYLLDQNYPNPFNARTSIRYALPEQAFVTLKVFDLIGREVATLVEATQAAGQHVVTFEANDLPSGVYLYRLTAGNVHRTKQLVLVK